MKKIILLLFISYPHSLLYAQFANNNPFQSFIVYDSRHLSVAPVFSQGIDSCKRFYFSQFTGMDSILAYAVSHHDTGIYLRIYFSFVVTSAGIIEDAHFEKIGAALFPAAFYSKKLAYFEPVHNFLEQRVQQMLQAMPFWKPGIKDGIPVNARMRDFIQCRILENLPGQQ
ncbi:MAG: hypothetical protein RLZZ28_2270 [Bacteroidota bacterium]